MHKRALHLSILTIKLFTAVLSCFKLLLLLQHYESVLIFINWVVKYALIYGILWNNLGLKSDI